MPPHVQRLAVIINPAVGADEPILNTLNHVLTPRGVDWDVRLTKPTVSAETLVREVVADGVDVVAVYGGDGTQRDAAHALAGGQTPMLVLPGGTGNVLARHLGIPISLQPAIELLFAEETQVKRIDTVRIGAKRFLINAGTGLYETIAQQADRDLKNRFGLLAYALSGLKALINPQQWMYRVTIDDAVIETRAIACLLANIGSLGAAGITLSRRVAIDDGLLDVFLIDDIFHTALRGLAGATGIEALEAGLRHYQGRRITIETDQPVRVYADGDEDAVGETPMTIEVDPASLPIIMPLAYEADKD